MQGICRGVEPGPASVIQKALQYREVAGITPATNKLTVAHFHADYECPIHRNNNTGLTRNTDIARIVNAAAMLT